MFVSNASLAIEFSYSLGASSKGRAHFSMSK